MINPNRETNIPDVVKFNCNGNLIVVVIGGSWQGKSGVVFAFSHLGRAKVTKVT